MSRFDSLRPEILTRVSKMHAITHLGQPAWVDGKGRIYMICHGCRRLVRVNKPLIGSMHYCDK